MLPSLCGALLLLVLATFPCPLAAAPLPADPSPTDRLIFTGAVAQGTTSLTFANNIYSFTFQGDETLTYQVNLSDPLVAAGTLRIREVASDSWPVDGGGFVFRGPTTNYYFPPNYQNTTTLTGHSASGKTLTLDYLLDLNGLHPVRYEITIEQKALRIRGVDPTGSLAVANNFAGMTFGKMTGVESPVRVQMQGTLAVPTYLFRRATPGGNMHFFIANMVDLLQCNGSDYGFNTVDNPVIGPDSVNSSLFTFGQYKSLSNDQLAAPFDDNLLIVVSSRIQDVLLASTAPISPYRGLLTNRMFFNGPESVWSYYSGMFDLFMTLGMDNLAGYFFDWSSSSLDPPAPLNIGPDWSPALDENAFKAMLQKGAAYGALVSAYTNFNSLPPTAPPAVSDPAQVARTAAGAPKKMIGTAFNLLAVEASAPHAQYESQLLKQLGANSAYLDIHTYGSISKAPDGDHLDQVASSPWAKTMKTGFLAQKSWFEDMRDILEGPLTGEGSIANKNTNMEFLWYGQVDSVQRAINSGSNQPAALLPAGSPFAPTNWPIIPEYEWRVAAKVQINHGNGFYDRFFGLSDGPGVVDMSTHLVHVPLTQEALDLYQAFLITYGHAGYLVTNGTQSATQGYVTNSSAAQTYFMTNALQGYYFASPVAAIGYYFNGSFKSFEKVLFQTETTDTFRHIPIALLFENGLRMYVNHGLTPMTITDQGVNYTLPARTGWYASMPGPFGIQCFSAIPPTTGGNRIDYCRAPAQYEYFNGRGSVDGFGGITTTSKRSKWTVTSSNLTVTEDEAGILSPSFGPAPALVGVQIFPGTFTVAKGTRIGVKAVAFFSNGGARDVTTLLDWGSTKKFVASINQAGIIEGLNQGQTFIVGILPGGDVITNPMSVTVP